MKKLILISCLLITTSTISAQQKVPVRMQMPEGKCEFLNNKTSTAIPFQIINNLIIIQIQLNGKAMNLVLDSGMPIDGIVLYGSSKVDSAKLSFTAKMPLGGVGGNAVLSDACMGASFNIPDLSFSNQMIVVTPHDQDRSLHFEGQDGIIGFSFFGHLIVSIDYEKQLITVSQPGTINESDLGQRVPVEVRSNRIFVKSDVQLENGTTIPAELIIDAGNGSALNLNTGSSKDMSLPDKTISYFARGLTGRIDRKIGRIKSIKIGGFQFNDVLSSFNDGSSAPPPPWAKEGDLGNEILRRFHITFDIPNRQIFLKKNKSYTESFEYTMAGIQTERAADKNFIVINVISGSAASRHLQAGDKITKVNGKSSSQISKDELEKLFKNLGDEVSLVIERAGEKINTKLKLERII